MERGILLTTPTGPYPTLPGNDSLTDATGQRFTKGDGMFGFLSHTHCFANHILAQNIDKPATLLEYPRWEDFEAEVAKGYEMIGISAFPVHLDAVMKMCSHIREASPSTRIMLGSYAAQAFDAAYDEQTKRRYVDDIVKGEGVCWMRQKLGEDTDRPVQQRLMPKAGGSVPFLTQFPSGAVGFLVSGLGCIGGCDFCSSTALFNRKRIELLTPEGLVENMALYHREFPEVKQVFVVEEDHFRQPAYLDELRRYWMGQPELMERVDWFGFGSVDYISQFAEKHGWDAIAELGIGCVFIGVESKFAGDHGYEKRDGADAREVFDRLHGMGIRTIGAWICGWDWHDHGNIHEDLNYFVSLCPTYQQLTRLSPFPGTKLWDQLSAEGRVMEVPWEDVHFWSGSQKNAHLEPHETLNLTEEGYALLNRTWGPSLLRRLDVILNGLAFCRASNNPVMREHRAKYFERDAATFWLLLRSMDRFAPNGIVRRRVRKADERYRALMGEPSPVMKGIAAALDALAVEYRVKEMFDPQNRRPKEEPFKRYTYTSETRANGGVPYVTEWPGGMSMGTRRRRLREDLSYKAFSRALQGLRLAKWMHGQDEIDRYLIDMVRERSFSFGF